MDPKKCIHVLTPETCGYDLIWEKGLCVVIKGSCEEIILAYQDRS